MFLKVITCLLILVPNVALASNTYYLKIDGVPGESQRVGHENEIDVLGISWKISQNGRSTCIEGMDLIKQVDLSSALLLMGQAEGRVYPEAVLSGRSSGEVSFDFLVITLYNVYVSTLSTNGSAGEDTLTENLTLVFDRATYSYTTLDDAHSPGPSTSAELFQRGRCR